MASISDDQLESPLRFNPVHHMMRLFLKFTPTAIRRTRKSLTLTPVGPSCDVHACRPGLVCVMFTLMFTLWGGCSGDTNLTSRCGGVGIADPPNSDSSTRGVGGSECAECSPLGSAADPPLVPWEQVIAKSARRRALLCIAASIRSSGRLWYTRNKVNPQLRHVIRVCTPLPPVNEVEVWGHRE